MYYLSLCGGAANAQTSLRESAESSEHLLLVQFAHVLANVLLTITNNSFFFWPILVTDIGSYYQSLKYVISQFQAENSIFKEQKMSPFCDLLTAWCHSRLYYCFPNIEMCL